jgi:hypothetical protein
MVTEGERAQHASLKTDGVILQAITGCLVPAAVLLELGACALKSNGLLVARLLLSVCESLTAARVEQGLEHGRDLVHVVVPWLPFCWIGRWVVGRMELAHHLRPLEVEEIGTPMANTREAAFVM